MNTLKLARAPLRPTFDAIARRLFLRRVEKILLFEGLQSGGSSLVSTCFLQHPAADGIYDMFHYHDFREWMRAHRRKILERTLTFRAPVFVLKFTCGHHDIHSMVASFQGVRAEIIPVFITRDIRTVVSSWLRRFGGLEKVYDCIDRDGRYWDTPIKPLQRIERFCNDLRWHLDRGHHVLRFEDLCLNPEPSLRQVCDRVGLPFDPQMIRWSKLPSEWLDHGGGNVHGDPFSCKQARCACNFDADLLDQLQSRFRDYFDACGYPLIERPVSFLYQKGPDDRLVPVGEVESTWASGT